MSSSEIYLSWGVKISAHNPCWKKLWEKFFPEEAKIRTENSYMGTESDLNELWELLVAHELNLKPYEGNTAVANMKWRSARHQAIKDLGLSTHYLVYSSENEALEDVLICAKSKYAGYENLMEPVPDEFLEVDDSCKVKLLHFCTKYGITLTKPKWYIHSYFSG